MPLYRIPIEWTQVGYYYIDADSLEEAIDKAQDLPLPLDGDYLDDSFNIWDDMIEEVPKAVGKGKE